MNLSFGYYGEYNHRYLHALRAAWQRSMVDGLTITALRKIRKIR